MQKRPVAPARLSLRPVSALPGSIAVLAGLDLTARYAVRITGAAPAYLTINPLRRLAAAELTHDVRAGSEA